MSAANNSILCYVTDRRSLSPPNELTAEQAILQIAGRAAAAGVDWIQVREKDLGGRALADLVSALLRRASRARILVNDRLDIAFVVGAGGIHLGGQGLPVAAVQRWRRLHAPAAFLVGASCHSLDEAQAAERDGADYIFFGPVFSTPSKAAFGPAQGAERLAEVAGAVSTPVVAIGGITPANAAACIAAGASGVAAIRWFQEQGDLADRVAELRAACQQ